MTPMDSIFLLGESREHPMHVGSLQLFEPPEGAGPEFIRDLTTKMVANQEFEPTFRKHPMTIMGGIMDVGWTYSKEIDVDYHLRRSALPSPGRVRELLELTSRLHSTLLDRHRPLWEGHVIEGLKDGRFAFYTKVQHSLLDGVSALKLMQRALSDDLNDLEVKAIWNLKKPARTSTPTSPLGALAKLAGSVVGLAPATFSLAKAAFQEEVLAQPFGAPRSMFNVKIGGARRCAAQSYSMERIKAIKRAAGVSLNDVIMAMCSGALRAYLIEHDALPDAPLVAMVPISLRTEAEADAGGNLVGATLCNLGTHLDDAGERLDAINESMRRNKAIFSGLSRVEALALSAINCAPMAFAALPGFVSVGPRPFNVVISNVPGPTQQMYLGGARLDGIYPMSIVMDGLALNITLVSTAETVDFGLVGCRARVPHLQRLLTHLDTALADLEKAVGV